MITADRKRMEDGDQMAIGDDRRWDISNAAIVVIDVQNDFCHERGRQGRLGKDLSRVDRTVDNIIELTTQARRMSVPVVLAYTTHSPRVDSAEWVARRPKAPVGANCVEGAWGSEMYRIAPEPADLLVEKHRYSAFVGTRLEDELIAMGRRSLFFCGYTTSACVESSLRDAVCRDFFGSLVDDCCDCYTIAAHQRAEDAVRDDFGAVVCGGELVEIWKRQVGAA